VLVFVLLNIVSVHLAPEVVRIVLLVGGQLRDAVVLTGVGLVPNCLLGLSRIARREARLTCSIDIELWITLCS